MDGWLDRTPRRRRECGEVMQDVCARVHALMPPIAVSSSVIFMASTPEATPTHTQIEAQQVRDKQKASGSERYSVYVTIRTWHDGRFQMRGRSRKVLLRAMMCLLQV